MDNALIIVDMQHDFIDGALKNEAAQKILSNVALAAKNWDGDIFLTMDTHDENYLLTQEGFNLPVEHCIKGTSGWNIHSLIRENISDRNNVYTCTKTSFGDVKTLKSKFDEIYGYNKAPKEIYLCGTCTDICVVSVALNLKALYPETKMYVFSGLCAGLTEEKHEAALEVMKSCQIEVLE